MKSIARILSLTAALALAAIPAAPSQTWGFCYYSCCSTPFQCQSYSPYVTESQCCSGEATICPAGMTVRGVSWGSPRQRCTF
jgi:hypothetical protein